MSVLSVLLLLQGALLLDHHQAFGQDGSDEPATIQVGQATLSSGDSVVFLGDSITHQRLYTQYIENFFITRFPDVRLQFHNAGISGDLAWDALQRLDRDVLSKDPRLVTILLGMNDGRYKPFDQEIFDTYRKDMTTLVDRLSESGAVVAPITPTMFDAVAAKAFSKHRARDPSTIEEYNALLAYFGTWLRDDADRRGLQSIDMFGPLNQLTREARQARPDNPEFTYITDAVHPGSNGQLIMAFSWLQDLGMKGPVSNITLVPTKKGYRARVAGGEVSDLVADEDEISFNFMADSLPWVTPDATIAANQLRLGHRYSREGFQVHGLEPGKYELLIDNISIGQFSQTQLAAHIELQKFPSTPQSVQANRVVAMNQARNQGVVRQLRDHWFIFRNLQRNERQLASVTDEKAKSQLEAKIAKGKEAMKTFESKLAAIEQKADEELAAVYDAAQPTPHRYVLKRVE
ncbi:MAG: SGNH/GDSL hydrolase family protein [Planctomycetota bacterium]